MLQQTAILKNIREEEEKKEEILFDLDLLENTLQQSREEELDRIKQKVIFAFL